MGVIYMWLIKKATRSIKLSSKVQNNPINPDFFPVHLSHWKRKPELAPQHNHPGLFEWFFCVAGSGTQIVNQWQCRVSPGDLIIIPPGLPHVFCADSSGCNCQVLMLSADYFEGTGMIMDEAKYILDFWKKHSLSHGFKADIPAEKVNQLRMELSGKEGIGMCAAIFSLLETAFLLPHPPSRPEARNKDRAIQEVLHYLNNHFSEKITVADALRISGLSRSSFHRRFFNATGITFCRYLNRLRLNAVNWMATAGIVKEEAARHCGFTSRSNYYQQMRQAREYEK